MNVTLEGASMTFSGVELEGVSITGKSGGLSVDIGTVEVDAGWFGALAWGTGSIDAVTAREVAIEIELGSEFQESLRQVREANTARAAGVDAGIGAGDSASSREYSAFDVSLSVRDEYGELVRATGGKFEREGDGHLASAAEFVVGTAPGDHASLTEVAVHLSATRILEDVSVGGGVARWAGVSLQVVDNTDDSAPSLTESPLLRRLQSARESLSAGPIAQATAAAPGGGRLAEDFSVSVRGLSVHSGQGEDESVVLSGLSATVQREGEGAYHMTGSGAPGDGGELGWDLHVVPSELRGEGSIRFHELPLAVVAPLLPDIPWHEASLARLNGDVVLEANDSDRIEVRGTVSLANAALSSPRLANHPVGGIGFELAGEGVWIAPERRLEIETATLSIGGARASMEGSLIWSEDRYVVNMRAALPLTDCNTALGAIPDDLLEDAAGFSWGGQVAARVNAQIDSAALNDTVLDIDVTDLCEFRSVPAMADLRRVDGPFDHRVLEPDGTWFEMVTGPGSGNWASIYGVSPFLVHAVLGHEDGGFFRHSGFSTRAIRDAVVRNLTEGRFVYGASTITMQLAKNLFLHRQKTLARKVQEVLLTWWLESALEKRDILEIYLNVIEYGPAVYGIRQAAWHYFGRGPGELSPAESVFLAAVLPSPKAFHVHRERGALSASMRNRLSRQLHHLASRGRIDDAALAYGLSEIPGFRFRSEGGATERTIQGSASPLPFGSPGSGWMDDIVDPWAAAPEDAGDEWDNGWEDVTPEPEG